VYTSFVVHPASYPVVTGGSYPNLKQLRLEADYLSQCSAEVRNAWSYTTTSPHVFIAPILIKHSDSFTSNRLCGLVVRVPGYRSRGPGFDSRRYKIFWEVVGPERGSLSLVRIIEELLEWKSCGSGLENQN
jgi:hypothetical protein